jgi:hypothetical protein
MKISLTNGRDKVAVVFHAVLDAKDCESIRAYKRPVTKALKLASERLGITEGWYPVSGQALEGL